MTPDEMKLALAGLMILGSVNMTLLCVLAIVAFRTTLQLERIGEAAEKTHRMLSVWAVTWGQDPALVQRQLLAVFMGEVDDSTAGK